jgi:hypothetical protein
MDQETLFDTDRENPNLIRLNPRLTVMDCFDGLGLTNEDQIRLCGELEEVRDLMSDGAYRTVREIHGALEGRWSETGISARLRDLRKKCFGGHVVTKRRRSGGLWEYGVMRDSHDRA